MFRTAKSMTFILMVVVANIPSLSLDADDNQSERRALFGELHMHTHWSMDAYIFKTVATPDDAYDFAKGKPLRHPNGQIYQHSRPLDFMAVTDHGIFLGVFARAGDPSHPMSKLPIAKQLFDATGNPTWRAFRDAMASARAGNEIQGVTTPDEKLEAWQYIVDAANRHNDPGKFTTFIAYEWTSTPDNQNLHRNVFFKGDSAPVPFTAMDSTDPEDLWAWMDQVRDGGTDVLAIPHNSNLSDGRMFERLDSLDRPLTASYAATRNRNEPLVEVTQIKGTSETHPMLSPNDEFADFERVELYVAQDIPVTKFAGSYVRDAYRTGLEFQDKQKFNPYRFGLIAASDSHTGLSPTVESNFSGPSGINTGTPARRLAPGARSRLFGASGTAGVWADENTRDGVFEALRRKETWGTTGPRMQVRFFGGWDMTGVDPSLAGWVDKAYREGVPMGDVLPVGDGQAAPTFVIWAVKDAESANLDRVQIVKGWSEDGVSHERVYDAIWSGNREPDSETGKLPPVGNTVNFETLQYSNTIGSVMLNGTWSDPEFNADQNAFYYVRALEIPTPRWSMFDAKALGVPHPEDIPRTIQERAYSSPIWYDARVSR